MSPFPINNNLTHTSSPILCIPTPPIAKKRVKHVYFSFLTHSLLPCVLSTAVPHLWKGLIEVSRFSSNIMGKRAAMGGFFGCFTCTGSIQSHHEKGLGIKGGSDGSLDETLVQPKSLGLSKISDCDESCCSTQEIAELRSVRRFSWEEIERLTVNFSEVIGVGGFSTVYLARFPDSSMGAVKVYNGSERLKQVAKAEVDIAGQLCHPNIVTLLGYCDERDEGVLVFEYIPHGDLQGKLHNKTISQVLPWKTRMAIAFQVAQALEHLHEQSSPHIVHGDIKASNILLHLDELPTSSQPPQEAAVSCKLCDFGFAKMGFSSSIKPHSSSSSSSRIAMMGSPGYIDPHYLMTGIASKKSDIYSFGVILLELITGAEAFCPGKEQLLTTLVRTNNKDFDIEKVVGMVDPRLGTGFDAKEARAMACISATCLHHLPSLRPSATEICQAMKGNISSVSSLCVSSKM